MTAELRPYQHNVVHGFNRAVEIGKRRIIIVAPTGSGKTVIASAIAAAEGRRVLFLAHRREIIQQTSAKLHEAGLDHGVIQAGFPTRPGEAIQVASIQTLHARAIRGSAMELPAADLVIIDEAHHCRAETYQKIIARYPEAIVLGLTATPCRGDGRGLGNDFEHMVECPQVEELIKLGYLVGTRVWAPTTPDLQGITVRQGDYAPGELEQRMDKPQLVGDVVTHWHRLAQRRKTVVFASGVNHSVHLRDEFLKSDVRAEHIDGSTPKEERDAILDRLRDGTTEVVTNCMVLTEGWDMPDIGCIVLARPTKQMGLYRQMIGRGLRPAQGKADVLMLDHSGATHRHGFAEDHVTWTLDTDRRAENKAHEARRGDRGSRLCECPKCQALRVAGEACRSCGYLPKPKARSIEFADGELGRIDRSGRVAGHHFTPEAKAYWHAALWFIADERARARPFNARGWVYHKFVERFGHKPAWDKPAPVPPNAEIRSWVRSRDIAFAKAAQKTQQQGAAA
jgi:superfamily II DNA or RNA helicase